MRTVVPSKFLSPLLFSPDLTTRPSPQPSCRGSLDKKTHACSSSFPRRTFFPPPSEFFPPTRCKSMLRLDDAGAPLADNLTFQRLLLSPPEHVFF